MNENIYAALAGVVLSLLFAYVPKLKDWYNTQPSQTQQLIMLAAIFVVIAVRFGLGCLGKDPTFQCTTDGAWEAVQAFFVALIFNAGTYGATKYIATGKVS